MPKKKPSKRRPWRYRVLAATAVILLAAPAIAQTDEDEPRRARGRADTTAADDEDKRREIPEHDVLGVVVHPYFALAFLRPSGPDQWSAAAQGGVELDVVNPVWFGIDYTLHDILDEADVFPWNNTLTLKLGLHHRSGMRLLTVPTYGHVAATLARPSDRPPDSKDWSAGFEAGAELDVEPLYVGLDYTLHDLFAGAKDEIIPWDGTFALRLGVYW